MKKLLTSLSLFVFSFMAAGTLLAAPLASPAGAFDILGQACEEDPEDPDAPVPAVCQEAKQPGTGEDAINPISGEDGIIIRVANIIAVVSAVIAVIIIVIAGITMVLSGGDSGKIKESRDAIIYAAVGLVVIALARTIVGFVATRL